MAEQLNQDDQVRRIDASLRAAYPNLSTRIFEIAPYRFVLVFDIVQEQVNSLEEVFDERIRYASVAVKLSNQVPQKSLRELQPLTDAQAFSDLRGLPLRAVDLLNLLLSKHPDSGLVEVSSAPAQQKITLTARHPIEDAQLKSVATTLAELGYAWPILVAVVEEAEPTTRSIEANPMFIWASALRPHAPTHVRTDELFWFDNLDDIAAGHLSPKDFPGIRPDVFRCFFDLTMGGDHINLRQAVMLYDEVWCSLPLAPELAPFLNAQGLTRDDLLVLIEAGRLRIVTTQPEERLDVSFLEAVVERDPTALMGRRTTAALLMADVAQTAIASRLTDPALQSVAGQIADVLTDVMGGSRASHLGALLWPYQARRGGLQSTLDLGSKAGPALDLGRALAAHIHTVHGLDLELELSVLSEGVHIAHALNATLFPRLDQPEGEVTLMSGLARDFNFHRSFNTALTPAWIGNQRRRASGVTIMPSLSLFEFSPRVPITELISDTTLSSTRGAGRSLMARMTDLHPEAREAEAEKLEKDLRGRARRRDDRVIDLDALDTGVSLATTVMDISILPVTGLMKLGQKITERLRHVAPVVDQFISDLERDAAPITRRNQDLDFLSRIQRVARFRQPTV